MKYSLAHLVNYIKYVARLLQKASDFQLGEIIVFNHR